MARWTKAAKESYRRVITGVGGYGTFQGARTKATLKIGRKTGLQYGPWKEGEKFSLADVLSAVTRRRIQHIGVGKASYTAHVTKGRYKDKPEDSIEVEIIWTPDQERDRQTFYRNIARLAQEIAGDFAQREVYVEWDAPGRRGKTSTASPKAAPSPLDNRFCAWVRQFSPNAHRDPDDPCYEKLSIRKKTPRKK